MDFGELPAWMGQRSFEDIVIRPAVSSELRAIVTGMQAGIWHSPVRMHLKGAPFLDDGVRVSALTMPLRSGCVLTLVMLGLAGALTNRQSTLHAVVRTYSARFSDEKWHRTRWFLAEANGALAELKLQASELRKIWFMQEFTIQ
jgi:hypothetical protein